MEERTVDAPSADAVSLLIGDHNQFRGLFERFRAARDAGDVATMDQLAQEIFSELEVHTSVEEDVFYPWVRTIDGDLAAKIEEGVEEHHVVDVTIAELTDVEVGSDEWIAKMTVLMENVEHHIDEEEEDMFPPVRSHSSADDRRAMGVELDAAKYERGAPSIQVAAELTNAELHRLATDQHIPGRSTMGHDELALAVRPPT